MAKVALSEAVAKVARVKRVGEAVPSTLRGELPLVVSGSRDGFVRVWSEAGTLMQQLKAHRGTVQHVGFAPLHEAVHAMHRKSMRASHAALHADLAAGGADANGALRLYGATGIALAVIDALPKPMQRLCDCVVSSGTDGVIRLHDALVGKPVAAL